MFEISIKYFINIQVKLLEAELRRNHFKPTEEKKFITEIDKLNRSRRAIREHIVLKVTSFFTTKNLA